LRLACALGQFWQSRGRALEGFERISRLLERAESAAGTEVHSVALAWRAEFALNCGKFDIAREAYLESLVASRNANHLPGILRGLNGIAVVICRSSGFADAMPYLEEALSVARDSGGSASLVGSVLTNVANIVMQQGEFDKAQHLHAEAARLFAEVGDELALAWSVNHQGDVERSRGDLVAARRLYDDALSRFRAQNERLGIAGTLHDLPGVAAYSGNHGEATTMNLEALAMYCAMDHKADVPRVLDALAISAVADDRADRALTLAGSAAAMRKAYGLYLKQTMESRLEESLELARRMLGGQQATASWMAGWSMQPEQAIAYALAATGES
jgi:tetratricopeptide (TPR) repeat protein